MKNLIEKNNRKKEEKAKQKLEADLTNYMTDEEKQKLESYAKKQKWAKRISRGMFASLFALALINGDQTIGLSWLDPLASFYENISNFVSSSFEYVLMHTELAFARMASVAVPFVLGYKFLCKSDFYLSLKNNIEERAQLRRDGIKKGDKVSLLSKAKSIKEIRAKKNLENYNEKLSEEEINNLEKQIHLKEWKSAKLKRYILAGTSIALMAVLGHQLVDGVFYDTALSIGQNISNFFSTGSVYDGNYSFLSNLKYMFYSAINNFELHKPTALGLSLGTIFSVGGHSLSKFTQQAEKYELEELNGVSHRKGLVKSFFDKMLERKNEGKDIEPAIPTIIANEKTK